MGYMYVCTAGRGPSPTAAKEAQPHGGDRGLTSRRRQGPSPEATKGHSPAVAIGA